VKTVLDQYRSPSSFLDALDRGLDVFGANVHVVVYFELNKMYGISREQIPSKPDLFIATIDKLFGVGAAAVSRAIRKELESATGIQDLSKKDLLTALRSAYKEQLRNSI
jgi:hypothetical protein